MLQDSTRLLTAWSLQQQAAGYPARWVKAAADRAIGITRDKCRGVSATIYGQAFQDILARELSLQVDWMTSLQKQIV